jgi:hypothetical protein
MYTAFEIPKILFPGAAESMWEYEYSASVIITLSELSPEAFPMLSLVKMKVHQLT